MPQDQSIQSPETQRKLGGSDSPGNAEDPVEASVKGGCGLPVIVLIVISLLILTV